MAHYKTEVCDGMRIDWDGPVRMKDGVTLPRMCSIWEWRSLRSDVLLEHKLDDLFIAHRVGVGINQDHFRIGYPTACALHKKSEGGELHNRLQNRER